VFSTKISLNITHNNVKLTSIVCNRSLFESCEGLEGSKGLNCFVSKITLCIPSHGNLECEGEARADKKSSFDSAAVQVLYELQRLGKITIDDVSQ
jgi:endoribonuclease Dicer